MNAHGEVAEPGRAWALLLARLVLGLIFFMTGIYKIFDVGLIEQAESLFVEPYSDTFLPVWSLWASGVTVPFVELIAGLLVIVGLWRKPAYLALGGVLVLVTFGHLLANPFFPFHHDVFPRALLVVLLLWAGPAADRYSIDELRQADLNDAS
ncbi:MAG: DoxX family protein [Gemmatimonadota bacterium]